MCVLIFSTSFVWNIFRAKKKWARYDRKCNVRIIPVRFNETCIFSTYFQKILKNFHANPSSGNRVVPCGRRDRQTKLVVAFRSFVNAPENGISTGCAWQKESTALGELLLWDFETSLCASRALTVDQVPVVCITKYWSVHISLFLSTSCARVCDCWYNYEHTVRLIVP